MKKSILLLFLLTLFMLPVYGQTRTREEKINYLLKNQIIEGYDDSSLREELPIKRSEITALLIRALGLTPPKTNLAPFPDVPADYWGAPVISLAKTDALSKNGLPLIQGYPDGTFRPGKEITNGELVKILTVFGKKNLSAEEVSRARWPETWMTWGEEEGIIGNLSGLPHLSPSEPATRGDAFVALYNALEPEKNLERGLRYPLFRPENPEEMDEILSFLGELRPRILTYDTTPLYFSLPLTREEFRAFIRDLPFYDMVYHTLCKNISVIAKERDGRISGTLQPQFREYRETILEARPIYEQALREIRRDLCDNADDEEKARAIHDKICELARYPLGPTESANLYGDEGYNLPSTLLTKGIAACGGYTTLFSQMALDLGLEEIAVVGKTGNAPPPGDPDVPDVNHGWNMVKIDGLWYHVDVTWDDSGTEPDIAHTYDYFLVSDKDLVRVIPRTWDHSMFPEALHTYDTDRTPLAQH